jgi:hypothetical protein
MRGSSSNAGSIFLRIAEGKIVETVTPDHPNAVKRVNKQGKEVYERIDDFVQGTITSIFEHTNEYNGEQIKELRVRLQDGADTYQLSLKEGSRYWSSFAIRMPNVDLKRPVKFSPFSFTDKTTGANVVGMNLFQGSEKVQPRFTKENPGKMPQGSQVMFQGKPKWDFYARDQFLIGVINYVAGQLRVDGEAVAGETGMPVHQPQATSQSQPVFTQPVAQAMGQTPPHLQQAPPPTTQYPGTVVPPQAPMPTQQPQHITSEVDDLPW